MAIETLLTELKTGLETLRDRWASVHPMMLRIAKREIEPLLAQVAELEKLLKVSR